VRSPGPRLLLFLISRPRSAHSRESHRAGEQSSADAPDRQGRLTDILIPPVYAASLQTAPAAAVQSSLAIRINQPRYLIVLDRARSQTEAQQKLSQLTQRLRAATPARALALQVQKQADEFLVVVGGGPKVRSDALLEAVRLKNTYGVNPALVEVPAGGCPAGRSPGAGRRS
jgi:hypothetical protein